MDILQQHEVFEIEVLDRLNRSGMLEPLVFGGGSMLRLCYFKEGDFKVTLGSILEPDMREYYTASGFSYLKEKLNAGE